MKKYTVDEKIKVLNHYINNPSSIDHPEVLRAIKVDILRTGVSKTKRANETSTPLYNACMGKYRAFMKTQGVTLKVEGRKARTYKDAMIGIIFFTKSLLRTHGSSDDNPTIEELVTKLFASWHLLKDFHRRQIGLPEIYKNIEEIVAQIRNGKEKRDSSTTISDNYKKQVIKDLQS